MNKTVLIAGLVIVIGVIGVAFMMKGQKAVQPDAMVKDEQATGAAQQGGDGSTVTDVTEDAAMEKVSGESAVEIKGFAFSPASITVKAGTQVTFTNRDSVGHTATADDASFDTGILAKDESGTVTFDTPGTFTYHCTPHPNMKGTVVVE